MDFVATSWPTKFAAEEPTFPKLASLKSSQQAEIEAALKKGKGFFAYVCFGSLGLGVWWFFVFFFFCNKLTGLVLKGMQALYVIFHRDHSCTAGHRPN